MSETDRTADFLAKNLKTSHQDQTDPFKPQDVPLAEMPEDEDENTVAKSIVDEIIEETEDENRQSVFTNS